MLRQLLVGGAFFVVLFIVCMVIVIGLALLFAQFP